VNKARNSKLMIADFKHVVHIANENEEAQLLSSLHTMGYIEFYDLCELSCLENNLFVGSELPCSSNVCFVLLTNIIVKRTYGTPNLYLFKYGISFCYKK
jgi:hypothetical protein